MEVGIKTECCDHRQFGRNLLGGSDCSAYLGEVTHRLDEETIHTAFHQPTHLLGKEFLRRFRCESAHRFEELPRRSNVTHNEHTFARVSNAPPNLGCSPVEFDDAIFKGVHLKAWAATTEGIRGEELSASIGVLSQDPLDHIRVFDVPQFRRTTVGQARVLEHRPHGAVTHPNFAFTDGIQKY